MKLNEFKEIEEGILSNLLGDYGAAATSKFFGGGGGKTTQQIMAQNIFVKDFVGDAVSALETAIEGGLVDPNLQSGPGAKTAPTDPSKVTPEPGAPGAAPGAAAAGAAGAETGAATGKPLSPGTHMAAGHYAQQQQTTQNLNSYVQTISKQLANTPDKAQKIALTKEIVNYMADRKDAPEWENALKTVELVLKKNAGDPNIANAAIASLRAGKPMALNPAGMASKQQVRQQQSAKDKALRAKGPMMKGQMKRGAAPAGAVKEAWKIYYLNKLVEGAGLSFADLGLTVLKESKAKKYYIVETKFYKLNNIFESFIKEQTGGAMSIADYLKTKWFPQYMKGVNYSSSQQVVDSAIDAIQASYGKDKGRAGLEKLAKLSFALSKGNVPAGAQDAEGADAVGAQAAGAQAAGAQAAGAQAAGAQAAGAQAAAPSNVGAALGKMNSAQMAELAKTVMARLKGVDAKLHSEVSKEIATGMPTRGLDAKAPGAAPTKPGITDRPVTPAASDKVAEAELKRLKSLKNKILK